MTHVWIGIVQWLHRFAGKSQRKSISASVLRTSLGSLTKPMLEAIGFQDMSSDEETKRIIKEKIAPLVQEQARSFASLL